MGERVKRVTVKGFMDIHTMVEDRLLRCCVHTGAMTDGGPVAMPFCAAQTWPALGAMKVASAAGSAAAPSHPEESGRVRVPAAARPSVRP